MEIHRARAPQRHEAVLGGWLEEVPEGAIPTVTWRLRIRMEDHPGALARVAIRLADLECNILGFSVLPVPGGVLDEIVIRPAAGLTKAHVARAIREEGCEWLGITDAAVEELVDVSTASLATASRVIGDPSGLADAVRQLLSADMVTVVPAAEANPARTENGHRAVFQVGDDRSVVARRMWAPFAQLELSRIEALLGLLGVVRDNLAGQIAVTCEDGATVVLRQGEPRDASAVADLHGRCSANTLYHRYHTGMRTVPRRWLHRLLLPPRGLSVLAVCGREVVALGQLIPLPEGDSAEVSLLVEDAWQGNGLGSALLNRLAVTARARGYRELSVLCLPGEDGVRRTASRAGLRPADTLDPNGVLRISM
ncbi:GNAT superfamily N-acetyltransferase [Saccharomonospora amisosensis]|uniref:GNAT superfamily N-acetyltransferase n=1 Tax=Saccharomonospora amisosensis TaxID=1128677 RepID=A0A7X5ZQD5_9PSEU|nr:GNAT superfamily N-acetyltransferase [Saccharomonospora amisosensis]